VSASWTRCSDAQSRFYPNRQERMIAPSLADSLGSAGSASKRVWQLCFRKLQPPLFPLIGFEEARTDSIRRGIMLKTEMRLQGRPSRWRKPFSLRSLTMLSNRNPDQQLHHEHQRLVLTRMLFETPAVIGDAQTVRMSSSNPPRAELRNRAAHAPFDGNHLPATRHALLNHVWAEWAGNYIANSLEIRHGAPPYGISRHGRSNCRPTFGVTCASASDAFASRMALAP